MDKVDRLKKTESLPRFLTQQEVRISSLIKGAMTMEEIMKSAIIEFNIKITSTDRYAAMDRMLRSYVEYLNETGVIELNVSDGFLKYNRV